MPVPDWPSERSTLWRSVARVPGTHPEKTTRVLRDALVATAVAYVLVAGAVRDRLDAHVAGELADPTVPLVATPFETFTLQLSATVVVGTIVGLARVGGYRWTWARTAAPPGDWSGGRPVGWAIAGSILAVLVGAVAGVRSLPAIVTAIESTVGPAGTYPRFWPGFALIFSLSCGVGAWLAAALATVAGVGLASVRATAVRAAIALAASLAFGAVGWPFQPLSLVLWIGPILVGALVGVVLAVAAPWVRTPRPDPETFFP